MNRHPTYDDRTVALSASIGRMQGLLDAGTWPSGLELTDEDRQLIRWNLELARRERSARRLPPVSAPAPVNRPSVSPSDGNAQRAGRAP